MKITNRSINIMPFEEVRVGEVVYFACDCNDYETGYYLVIEPAITHNNVGINAIRLSDGEGYCIDLEEKVTVVTAELVITSR